MRGVFWPDYQDRRMRGTANGRRAVAVAADVFAASVAPMIQTMRQEGLTLQRIADKLTADGIRTARGGQWTATSVRKVLIRVAVER